MIIEESQDIYSGRMHFNLKLDEMIDSSNSAALEQFLKYCYNHERLELLSALHIPNSKFQSIGQLDLILRLFAKSKSLLTLDLCITRLISQHLATFLRVAEEPGTKQHQQANRQLPHPPIIVRAAQQRRLEVHRRQFAAKPAVPRFSRNPQ